MARKNRLLGSVGSLGLIGSVISGGYWINDSYQVNKLGEGELTKEKQELRERYQRAVDFDITLTLLSGAVGGLFTILSSRKYK